MGAAEISEGRFAVLRLLPGADLVAELHAALAASGAGAAAVTAAVGSLQRVEIRHADRDGATLYEGRFEIVALSGTLDPGGQHLHLAISDGEGQVRGGHLMARGAEVYTTAEIVLLLLPELRFERLPCAVSGYRELAIRRRGSGEGPG
ncbi:PCC domain-containing protein [Poseidonocella sp. HB161398]|uniref:PCC domain-containing protein n=1 Tax=Poseidonocella sp. HB161398 TaxID=2320855 RepID=UPI001109FC25|nr:DUF296 domain-containing protein [Poseidonocella sp. HB161398]